MPIGQLLKIHGTSKLVEQYSEVRTSRYGPDGVIPAEFLPVYQRLRSRDWTRSYGQIDGVVYLMKRISLFKVQYNRLEGLPLSLDGDYEAERKVTDDLLQSSHVQKVRCCEPEAEILIGKGYTNLVDEDALSNFWSNVDNRIARTSKASWRCKPILNWATKDGKLQWRPTTLNDSQEIWDLYTDWVEFKKEVEKQGVMYQDLYGSILLDHQNKRSDLFCHVMTYEGKIIAFVVYAISGEYAHLLMNICKGKTEHSEVEKLQKYMGQLTQYFTVRSLKELGIKYVLFGYCTEKEPLYAYKKANSEAETRLKICTIREPVAEVSESRKRHGFL
jgi:hypothetical protein